MPFLLIHGLGQTSEVWEETRRLLPFGDVHCPDLVPLLMARRLHTIPFTMRLPRIAMRCPSRSTCAGCRSAACSRCSMRQSALPAPPHSY